MRYRHFVILFLMISMVVTSAGTTHSRDTYMKTDTSAYPFSPSLIQFEKTSATFTPLETCSDCHPDKFEEWTGSMHALAFKDPVYQGELNLAVKEAGHAISRQCEGCHTPAAVVTGEIKGAGLKGLSDVALGGVSCDVCHSVKGHTHWQTPYHQPENGSLILSPGREGTDGEVLTKYGPMLPEDGCGDDFHQCVESSLHRSSELCASCHQVSNHETHTPLEETYREWKNGPYATAGIHCQDCHMVETATFKQSADEFKKPRREDYHHYFNGANFLLYYLTELAAAKAGDEELVANVHNKYTMAVDRLQAAAALEIVPVYRRNRLVEIKVRVKNIRAGHNLTTSLTNIRQMWLEVTATDGKGNVLMTTGTVGSNGRLPENSRIFNSHTQDKDLNFTLKPWEAESFSKNDTIPPKGYKDVYYGLSVDRSVSVNVEAKLRYRQADQKVAEKLLGMVPGDIHLEAVYGITKIPQLPIIDMVSKKVVIHQQ